MDFNLIHFCLMFFLVVFSDKYQKYQLTLCLNPLFLYAEMHKISGERLMQLISISDLQERQNI